MAQSKHCFLRLDRFYRLRESRYLSLPEQWEENTSASERELLGQYEQLVATYSDNMQIDVSSVIKDCGTIMTENGPVHLRKDTLHYLKRADIELLIQQGYLLPIS